MEQRHSSFHPTRERTKVGWHDPISEGADLELHGVGKPWTLSNAAERRQG